MIELLRLILHIMASLFKPRTKLVAEILILRQQLIVLHRYRGDHNSAIRSISVCLALSLVPFRPQRDCNSPPRDDHPLASRGVPVLLARAPLGKPLTRTQDHFVRLSDRQALRSFPTSWE